MEKTKNEMARVVVQALFNLKELPDKNYRYVKRYERLNKDRLVKDYTYALSILKGEKQNENE